MRRRWPSGTNRNGGTDHAEPRIAGSAPRAAEAMPTTGDDDGDGRTDLAVFFPYASWHWDVNLEQPNGAGMETSACDLEFWALDELGLFPAL